LGHRMLTNSGEQITRYVRDLSEIAQKILEWCPDLILRLTLCRRVGQLFFGASPESANRRLEGRFQSSSSPVASEFNNSAPLYRISREKGTGAPQLDAGSLRSILEGCRSSQGLGYSPIKAVRELGSERRQTVRSLRRKFSGLRVRIIPKRL
jgi:hypothetical protein